MSTSRTSDRSLSRLTPWVVVAGLVLGVLGVITALDNDPLASLLTRYIVVGLVCLAVGYWLFTKGSGRLGVLVALTGAAWYIPELQNSNQGLLVGLAIMFEGVFRATFAHSVLAYPDGRIRPHFGAWLVGAGYVLTLVGGLARALTYQPYYWESCECPRNSLAVWHTESVYNAVNDTYLLLGLVLGVALLVPLALKLSPENRDGASTVPVWAAIAGTTMIIISAILREALDLSEGGLVFWLWVEGIGILIAVISFLILGSRQRFAEVRSPAGSIADPSPSPP